MIKKIRVCDMCGQEIEKKVLEVSAMIAGSEPETYFLDYCRECTGKVVEFLTGHRKKVKETSSGEEKSAETTDKEKNEEETPAPEENSNTAEKKPKRKTLDKGKIMALKKAGWSNEKIADEMGTTKSSIASTVYMEKKKMQSQK